MKKTFNEMRAAALVAAMMLATAVMAQTAATPESSIGDAITKILAIIAVGGAGYVTLKLALVGWTVGAKFVSRLGGKA